MAKRRRPNTGTAKATGPTATTGPRKRGRRSDPKQRLGEMIDRHVSDLVTAINQHMHRNMAAEVRAFLAANGRTAARVVGRTRRSSSGRKRILPCIAPGCTNPSKGPRFHYLCEDHRKASRKDYEAWRLKAREGRAA